jgi:hypothetical protein
MSKIYKFLILNTKGGAGKSTACTQIAVPYLYEKTKQEVMVYEFDDENQESRSFGGSEIFTAERIPVGRRDLRDEVTEILLNDSTACIDVGANKTAVAVMEALLDSGMIYRVDLVIIPIMDGEIDALSAFDVYFALKEKHAEVKVVFALGRVNSSRHLSCQFDIFLGDGRGLFQKEGILSSFQPQDQRYFTIQDTDTIKYGRLFGVTVWELSRMEKDLDGELKEAIEKGADVKSVRLLSFKRSLKYDCDLYVKHVLAPAFEIIDDCLGE